MESTISSKPKTYTSQFVKSFRNPARLSAIFVYEFEHSASDLLALADLLTLVLFFI